MDLPIELIAILTPVVTYGAIEMVEWIKKLIAGGKIGGKIIIYVLVPAVSIGVSYVSQQLLNTELTLWAQAGYGLAAVFLNEVLGRLRNLVLTIFSSILYFINKFI